MKKEFPDQEKIESPDERAAFLRAYTSKETSVQILPGARFNDINLADAAWGKFVPSNQHNSGKNQAVFDQNFAAIEQKLGVNPFLFKSDSLVIPDNLTNLEVQQLALWLSFLSFKKIVLPTKKSDGKKVHVEQFRNWAEIFGYIDGSNKKGLTIKSSNADLIIPLLPYLPVTHLLIYVSSSLNADLSEISPEKAADLGKALSRMPSLGLIKINVVERGPESKLLLLPFLENIVNFPLKHPLCVQLNCKMLDSELVQFSKLLTRDVKIESLVINSFATNFPVFFQALSKSHLTSFSISESSSPILDNDNFRGLIDALPESLKSLSLTHAKLDDARCALLIPNLKKSNIEILNLKGNELVNFTEILGRAINKTKITELILNGNKNVSSIESIVDALKDPNCPLRKLSLTDCNSKEGYVSLPEVLKLNRSLTEFYFHCFLNLNCFNPTEKIIDFYEDLLKAMSLNLMIYSSYYYYGGSERAKALMENLQKLMKRNTELHNAQELLEGINSGSATRSLAEITAILDHKIPSALTEAQNVSTELKGIYPEGHQLCEARCKELLVEAQQLSAKIGPLISVQNMFREKKSEKKVDAGKGNLLLKI